MISLLALSVRNWLGVRPDVCSVLMTLASVMVVRHALACRRLLVLAEGLRVLEAQVEAPRRLDEAASLVPNLDLADRDLLYALRQAT